MAYAAGLIAERFAAKAFPEPNSGCWLWCDAPDRYGYGRLEIAGRAVKAHRLSYLLHRGTIGPDVMVCHRCDNRICVNPDHLFLGDGAQNVADMMAKGRYRAGGKPHPGEANGRATLTSERATAALYAVLVEKRSRASVARQVGVGTDAIVKLCAGQTWRHLPRAEAALLAAYQVMQWTARS